MKRAVFLDRDGTINQDVGYPRSFQELSVFPESVAAIRQLNQAGLLVIILTNQSGVGRGFLTEERLRSIHQQLQAFFWENGARIDGVYYCPHWRESSDPRYGVACDCRKPGTGMAIRAARDFDVDLNRSFMVGDKLEDVLCGHRIGAKSILVLTGAGTKAMEMLLRLREKRPGEQLLSEVRAGNETTLFSEINLAEEIHRLQPDFIANGLLEATAWILSHL